MTFHGTTVIILLSLDRGRDKCFISVGGVATQKNRTLQQISNLGLIFSVFFLFFLVFSGFSILANSDWFNGFLLSGSCWLL